MRKLLFIAMLLSGYITHAQFVTIPDSNFAGYLRLIIPAAMNGNQMDTTSSLVTTATTSINVEFYQISDIYGIQYFSALTDLKCGYNSLNILAQLPNSVKTLSVKANKNPLIFAGKLPDHLDTLLCYYSKISSLPSLPASLKYLDCENNLLNTLPLLPGSLKYLSCYQNKLNEIPALPIALADLYCQENNLTDLPVLPSGLLNLDCSKNNIKTFNKKLPASLKTFYCSNNQLTTIPALPDSLRALNCAANMLSCLPDFPKTLKSLDCSFNTITGLPILPDQLEDLFCDHNKIEYFPSFPSTIKPNLWVDNHHGFGYYDYHFKIGYNPNTCLPNYVNATGIDYNIYINYDLLPPLCNSYEPDTFAFSCRKKLLDNNQLSIYPNPTNGNLNIVTSSNETLTLKIFDFCGKLILNKEINNITTADLHNFSDGIYLISIINGSSVYNKKVILQKEKK